MLLQFEFFNVECHRSDSDKMLFARMRRHLGKRKGFQYYFD